MTATPGEGRIETGEMLTLDPDTAPPVDRGHHARDWSAPRVQRLGLRLLSLSAERVIL